ncbi:2-dehydropantoate 2-reductase [Photobacterium sp. SKA34]|uniref:2-dehydropantoate 2-reductase n=1 Tax=Photobacterium sp. SKA34 TaxID=121723 RepID=UPI001E56B1F2|nr:2-dehydropantoate 2-reductase [Photobacterium sp. SKA34]
MKITVLGAGAIGSLWAVALKQQQHDVQVWTRSSDSEYSVNYQDLNGNTHPLLFTANSVEHLSQSDLLLVTVKSFQVEVALAPIIKLIPNSCLIVIMHNGIGSHEAVKALFSNHCVFYATTSQAALKADAKLQHTGNGQTFIGSLFSANSSYNVLTEVFNQALSPCYWQDDIMEPLWKKLAINCAINPLTAIYQCTNGELANKNYQAQLIQVCNEVTLVMRAEGYRVKNDELYQQALTVINATADNYSSMNRDVFYQRPTEIDYITGYLIHRAKKFDIAVPVNTQLWQTIISMESSYHA